MAYISKEEKEYLIRELTNELHAKLDGGRKNLIVPTCPYCGKSGGKFGIYVGKETDKKKLFMSHCFSCGHILPHTAGKTVVSHNISYAFL